MACSSRITDNHCFAMQNPVPWDIVETWLLQLICGMADFEINGLSHNDIKPVSSTVYRPSIQYKVSNFRLFDGSIGAPIHAILGFQAIY